MKAGEFAALERALRIAPADTGRWGELVALAGRLGQPRQGIDRIGVLLAATGHVPEAVQCLFELVRAAGLGYGDPRFPSGFDEIPELVAFDPSGEWLVQIGRDGKVEVREAEGFDLLGTARLQGRPVACSFRRDGTRFSVCTRDGVAHVLDPREGIRARWTCPGRAILAVDPDLGTLAVTDGAGIALLQVDPGCEGEVAWDDREVRPVVGGPASWTADRVVFAPGGERLGAVSSGRNRALVTVACDRARVLACTEAVPADAFRIAFSPDGDTLAAAGWVAPAGIFRTEDLVLLARTETYLDGSRGLSIGTGSRLLGASRSRLHLFDLGTGRQIQKPAPGTGEVETCCLSPDGGRLASANRDFSEAQDVGTGRARGGPVGHRSRVGSLAVTRDGGLLTLDQSGELRRWDLATGRCTAVQRHTGLGSLGASPGRELVAAAGTTGYRILDGGTLATVAESTMDVRSLDEIRISPDGRRILVREGTHRIDLLDLATGSRMAGMAVAGIWPMAMDFAGGSDRIAVWGRGGAYWLAVESREGAGMAFREVDAQRGSGNSVRATVVGGRVVVSTPQGIHLLESGREPWTVLPEDYLPGPVTVSQDGTRIAYRCRDGLAVVDPRTGPLPIGKIEAADPVSLWFAPDGALLFGDGWWVRRLDPW